MSPVDPPEPPRRRPLLGVGGLVVVAVLGVVAVVGFVLGPVSQESFVFGYRPAEAGVADGGMAVAPLALARSTPDRLELTLPCDEGTTFWSFNQWIWWSSPGAEHSPLDFSALGGGLRVDVGGGVVVMMVGEREVLRVPVADEPGCVVGVGYDGVWRLSVGGREWSAEGKAPRFVEATFVGSAASSAVSSVVVETRELGTSPSLVQLLLLVVAAGSLGLVGREIVVRGMGKRRESGLVRRLLGSVVVVDVGVVVGLIVWWLVIPTNIDDGWIAATQNGYEPYGDFTGVYTRSAQLPLGYWVNWVQHFWSGLSSAAVVMRLPVLVLGVGTWAGLRSVGRSFGVPGTGGSVWLMGAVFLVGFGAWGMTLRVEPVMAALLVASLALAIRFVRGKRGWVVVAWVVVMALAVTAHPAGVVVVAPLLVSWRSVWGWVRSNREAALVGLAAAVMLASLIGLLVFIDSNLTGRLEVLGGGASGTHDKFIGDELLRYRLLGQTPYATAMRRMAVALIFIGVGAFLLRRRRGAAVENLPGWSLIVGLGLLSLTPSKWPWHFGGLLALAALVVAIELHRTGGARSLLAVAGIGAAMSWAWTLSLSWTALDLRTQQWWSGAANILPFELSSLAVWAGIGAATWGVVTIYRRSAALTNVWSAPEALVVVSALLVVAVTASTLVVDVVRTDGWTFGGQNVKGLVGASGCGLGDEIEVPVPGSLHGLVVGSGAVSVEADRVASRAGFAGGGVFERGGFSPSSLNSVRPLASMGDVGSWKVSGGLPADANRGSYRSEWFEVGSDDDSVVLMVMGSYRGAASELGNAVGLQWGVSSASGVGDLGVERAELSGYFTDWSLVEFEARAGADRVRLLLRDDSVGSGDAWVASSLPLGMSVASVGEVVAADQLDIVVTPPLALYFPCVDVPRFERAVVRPPGMMIQMWGAVWQQTFGAAAASDRYFRVDVDLDPPVRSIQIGAHTGDADNFIFVSQEYLTGRPARANGQFTNG